MVFRFSPSTPFIPRVQQPSTALREAIGANRRDARDQQRINDQRAANERAHERGVRSQDFLEDVDAYGRAERAEERVYNRRTEQAAAAHKAMEARRTHMMKAEAAAQDRENRGDVEGAARIRETARRMIPAAPAPVLAPGAGPLGSPMSSSAPGATFSPAPPTSVGSGETLAEALSSFDREGRVTDEDLLNADKGPDPYEAAKEDAGGALASVDSALAAPRTEASRTEQDNYGFSNYTRSKMQAAQKTWQAAATNEAGTANSRKAAAVVARMQPEIYQASEHDSKVADERSQAMFKALQGNYHPKRGGRGGGGGGSGPSKWQFKFAEQRDRLDPEEVEVREAVDEYTSLSHSLDVLDNEQDNASALSGVIFSYARSLNGGGVLTDRDVERAFEGVSTMRSLLDKTEQWVHTQLTTTPEGTALLNKLRRAIANKRERTGKLLKTRVASQKEKLRRFAENGYEEYARTRGIGLDASLSPVQDLLEGEKEQKAAEAEALEELGL